MTPSPPPSQVIWQALARSGPLLVNVLYVLVFTYVVFCIIGLESLGGSLRRQCATVGACT